jgi:predicted CoA-binding protein
MITQAQIQAFFNEKIIAVAGVSRNPKKFGSVIFKTLSDQQKYSLLPLNPQAETIFGIQCFKEIAQLPAGVNSILLITPKEKTAEMVQQAMTKGIKNIWIQQHTETPEAIQLASREGFNVIYGKCILMFANPQGFHKFHRGVMKFFGRLPK